MKVLVGYASRYGATAEIAGRIAERIRAAGHETDLIPFAENPLVASYDALVLGSAVYIGNWEKEASAWVEANRHVVERKLVWLFSSGPLGTEARDAQGQDRAEGAIRATTRATLDEQLHPRDHHVFYGALDPKRLSLLPRLMRVLPAGRKLLEEGDFRDWAAIEAWADGIAAELATTRVLTDVH